jgi:hypothetical protein
MQARSDLHRRKITQQGSDAVSDTEQKEALREAMRRLRVAEEKVALIKKLIPQLHRAIAEYHAHSQPLGDHLTGGFERSVATLEKMVIALESYIALAAPTAPRIEPAAMSSGEATTTGASTTTAGSTGGEDQAAAATAAAAGSADGRAESTSATAAGPAPAPAGEPVLPGRT